MAPIIFGARMMMKASNLAAFSPLDTRCLADIHCSNIPLPFAFAFSERFSASASLGIGSSELHASVGRSIGWASGELRFLSPTLPDDSSTSGRMRRSLQSNSSGPSLFGNGSDPSLTSEGDNLPPPPELLSLLNTLLTLLIAIMLTFIIQWAIIWVWTHRINKQFYLQYNVEHSTISPSPPSPPPSPAPAHSKRGITSASKKTALSTGSSSDGSALSRRPNRWDGVSLDGSGLCKASRWDGVSLDGRGLCSAGRGSNTLSGTTSATSSRTRVTPDFDDRGPSHRTRVNPDLGDEHGPSPPSSQKANTASEVASHMRRTSSKRSLKIHPGQGRESALSASGSRSTSRCTQTGSKDHYPSDTNGASEASDARTKAEARPKAKAEVAAKVKALAKAKDEAEAKVKALAKARAEAKAKEVASAKAEAKAAKLSFMPFPKTFVWPSTLIFVLAVFSTGLTRTAVTLLVSQPLRGCGAGCYAASIITLMLLVIFVCLLAIDLLTFRKKFHRDVVFLRAPRAKTINEVADPIMWMRAKAVLACYGFLLMFRNRKKGAVYANDRVDEGEADGEVRNEVEEANERPEAPAAPVQASSLVRIKSLSKSKYLAARQEAKTLFENKHGFSNRPSGAFAVAADGLVEPARTERILERPFAIWRDNPMDAYHQRLGFIFFRVSGNSRVGVAFRLLVLLTNMTIGVLGGLSPLLAAPDTDWSWQAAQAVCILSLQLAMAIICFCFLPDADKIFSIFAGTQFLVEGLSTACALYAWTVPGRSLDAQGAAFSLSVLAVFVPMVQLVEQRIFTPLVGGVRRRGCTWSALIGILLLIAMSLPRILRNALKQLAAGDDGADDSGSGEVVERHDQGGRGQDGGIRGELQPDLGEAAARAGQKYVATAAQGQELKAVKVGGDGSPSRRSNGLGEAGEGEGEGGGGDD